MAKRINMAPGASAQGGVGTGTITSSGNPWTVADGLADELVNRGVASYADPVTQPLRPVMFNPNTGKAQDSTGAELSFGGGTKSTRSNIGVWSPRAGMQSNMAEGNNANKAWLKIKFDRKPRKVRLWIMSREQRCSAGWQACIASTNRATNTTVAEAFTPYSGASTQNNVAAAYASPYGWYTFGWRGTDDFGPKGLGNMVSANAARSGILYHASDNRPNWDGAAPNHAILNFIKTEWLSVPAQLATDGSGYYYLLKIDRTSGLYGLSQESTSAYAFTAAQLQGFVNAGTGYMVGGAKMPAGAIVTDHTLLPTGLTTVGTDATNMPAFFLEVDYGEARVETLAFVGESHFEGYLIPDSSYFGLSTPALSLGYFCMGQSSNRSIEYLQNAQNFFKAGLGPQHVVLQSHSTNDQLMTNSWDDVSFNLRACYAALERQIDEYQSIGRTVWVCLMFYLKGTDNAGLFNNGYVNQFAEDVKALAAAKGCPLIDLYSDWNPVTMMAGDHTHASATGIDFFRQKLAAAARSYFGI